MDRMPRLYVQIFLVGLLGFASGGEIHAQSAAQLNAVDTPNDSGESISLSWVISDDQVVKSTSKIIVYRKNPGENDFKEIKQLDPLSRTFKDGDAVHEGLEYFYKISLLAKDARTIFETQPFGPVVARAQWFNTSKVSCFVFSLYTIFIVLLFMFWTRRGREFYLRPLPGVRAIEEAVGRATEMGRVCLYCPGISQIDDIATLASISILSRVAEVTAQYGTRIVVPNYDPVVYSVCDEVVKTAYIKVGRPEAHRPEDVYYLTGRQFAYASGVAGLIAREKPAANFFLGWFMAESLVLTESGVMSGAVQIGGTDAITQIPFFIVTCDYTLIGEELYAAGAYMANDRKLLGGLKGQDYVKLGIMVILVVLFLLRVFGVVGVFNLLTMRG